MSGISETALWALIILLGVGTFAIRFSFLGLMGDRPLPLWIERALRYVPTAVMPGLCAPLVLYPEDGGSAEPLRIAAALAVLLVAALTGRALLAVGTGAVALAVLAWAG
ncbi:MAG: AzlD domain-containing protein [Pseudomonadota bacterium]